MYMFVLEVFQLRWKFPTQLNQRHDAFDKLIALLIGHLRQTDLNFAACLYKTPNAQQSEAPRFRTMCNHHFRALRTARGARVVFVDLGFREGGRDSFYIFIFLASYIASTMQKQ